MAHLTSYAQMFLDQLPLIEQLIQTIARRHRLRPSEHEEFASIVHLRLMQDDYRILRRFESRSSLRTFLTVVISRLCLDYRRTLLGKWRTSAEAKRLGPIAVHLERLLRRDELPFDQACRTLRHMFRISLTDEQLATLESRLPARQTRRPFEDAPVDRLSAQTPAPDAALWAEHSRRIAGHLQRAIAQLDPRDQLVIRCRYLHGLSIAATACAAGLDVRLLYRRLPQILRQLRRELEAHGIRQAPPHFDW